MWTDIQGEDGCEDRGGDRSDRSASQGLPAAPTLEDTRKDHPLERGPDTLLLGFQCPEL